MDKVSVGQIPFPLKLRYVRIMTKYLSNEQIADRLKICTRTVTVYRKRVKAKEYFRYPKRFDFSLVPAVEEYMCGGKSLTEVAEKYNTSVSNLSRYTSYMIPLRQSEQTKIITLKSKV